MAQHPEQGAELIVIDSFNMGADLFLIGFALFPGREARFTERTGDETFALDGAALRFHIIRAAAQSANTGISHTQDAGVSDPGRWALRFGVARTVTSFGKKKRSALIKVFVYRIKRNSCFFLSGLTEAYGIFLLLFKGVFKADTAVIYFKRNVCF